MPHVLVKDGLISPPGGFHSGLGIFILAWAQARMKLPRQGYMSIFDTNNGCILPILRSPQWPPRPVTCLGIFILAWAFSFWPEPRQHTFYRLSPWGDKIFIPICTGKFFIGYSCISSNSKQLLFDLDLGLNLEHP